MIATREGEALARYARASIAESFGTARAVRPHGPASDAVGASFVSLRNGAELRGCIGTLDPRMALADDVASNARLAAFEDPRVASIGPDEVEVVDVEISILSATELICCDDEASACSALRPYVDGVVFRFGRRRSTYLPQVWELLPDPREFLAELKRKAGLPRSFWSPDIALERYTIEVFVDVPFDEASLDDERRRP